MRPCTVPQAMWKLPVYVLVLARLRYSLCDRSDDDTSCFVNNSYELQFALSNVAACRVLELRANITLTPYNFSAQGLTLTNQSIIIQSDRHAQFPNKLDFGTYTPSSAIQVTQNSRITVMHLQIQNFGATLVRTQRGLLAAFDLFTSAVCYLKASFTGPEWTYHNLHAALQF